MSCQSASGGAVDPLPWPCAGAYGQDGGQPLTPVRAQTATGSPRANPAHTRYFTDGSGKAIHLAGSLLWSNLTDRGTLNPPQVAFDYPAYRHWMVAHNLNFIALVGIGTNGLPQRPKADVDEGIVARRELPAYP
ncbi:MAG TPA: hypothetical protein VG206_06085 [Terriglobia bacterium]|nr:hypothetical protein [Terriglobia bacterium]